MLPRFARRTARVEPDLQHWVAERATTPGTVWLDSNDQSIRSRQSWAACEPIGEIRLDRSTVKVRVQDRTISRPGTFADALEALDRLTTAYIGIGQISYEAMLPLLDLQPAVSPYPIPLFHFLLYERMESRQSSSAASESQSWRGREPATPPNLSTWRSSFGAVPYLEAVQAVKHHITEGDIYQANLTVRWQKEMRLRPFDVYLRLRSLNPAPFSLFMNFGDYQILSSSPELMIRRTGNRLMTSPIKGTIRKSFDPKEDDHLREQLAQSAKDRAEHLMIVDLERNDLGRVARTGSVCVSPLAALESFASVHHLVSNVHAEVSPNTSNGAILKALLPGGSVTGAPKRRAVEILSQIEPTPRGVYTGCLGIVGNGEMHLNIAIRTMTHCGGLWTVAAGGGIVADSDPELEWQETCLKAARMFAALEGAA